MSGSWYDAAVFEIKKQQTEHPELDRTDMRKFCSKHYPFAWRRGWAYKSWLRAMNEIFGDRQKFKFFTNQGQGDFFSQESNK